MKSKTGDISIIAFASPPARGAWIEMHHLRRKETAEGGRPPHGGRGLKSLTICWKQRTSRPVAPRTGGVD